MGLKLEGVMTELPLPFREDLSVDYSSFSRMIDSQAEAGITGIYLHGVGCETVFLSFEEEVEVVRQGVRGADGRMTVIANILSAGQAQACERARAYTAAGADMLSISQPLFYQFTEEALLRYFSAVIESTDLPIMIYNMPSAGYTLSPGVIGTLSQRYDRVVAYKDSTQNVIHLQEVAARAGKPGFAILAGSDATIYSTLCTGGAGVISMLSMLFPRQVIQLVDTYRQGDLAGALAQQQFLLEVRGALKAAPLIAGYKTASKLLGLYDCDAVRPPLANTGAAEADALKNRLLALGLLGT